MKSTASHDAKELARLNPKTLRTQYGIRFKHLLEFPSGRLVGTIVSRVRDDGKVEVAATIANPDQGKVVLQEGRSKVIEIPGRSPGAPPRRITLKAKPVREAPATRASGREVALERLLNAKPEEIFLPEEAKKRIRTRVRNYEVAGPRPSDVKVVVFDHEDLKQLIRERRILSLFPGAKWVPKALRPRAPFKPRKPSKSGGFLSRLTKLFS